MNNIQDLLPLRLLHMFTIPSARTVLGCLSLSLPSPDNVTLEPLSPWIRQTQHNMALSSPTLARQQGEG